MKRTILIRNIILYSLLCTIALIGFTGCGHSGTIDNDAENIRAISLIPSVTQTIYEIGAEKQLCGCTNYCITRPEDSIEIVSSIIKPNVEKIVCLQPDIVFASMMTQPQDVESLRKFGIDVKVLPSPKNFTEICDQFIEIGTGIGKQQEAEKIIETYKRTIDSLSLKARGESEKNNKPKVFIQIGSDPIFGVLPGTFMDDYITLTGGENIIKTDNNGVVSREFVVTCNPDYIFIVMMGGNADNEIAQWNKISGLKAVQEGHVFTIDEAACQPTPKSFITTIQTIDSLMHINNK